MAGANSTNELAARMAGFFACRHKSCAAQRGRPEWLWVASRALLMFVVMSLITSPALVQATDYVSFLSLPTDSEIEKRYIYSSLYTTHYDPDPDHVNDQNMLGFELQMRDDSLWGLAMFDNSFGQDSQYLYVGRTYRALQSDRWYYKLTGGLLHGYKEPYEDKIPLNNLGVAPVIIPAIGYRNKHVFAEFSQLGLAAGMIIVGVSF